MVGPDVFAISASDIRDASTALAPNPGSAIATKDGEASSATRYLDQSRICDTSSAAMISVLMNL